MNRLLPLLAFLLFYSCFKHSLSDKIFKLSEISLEIFDNFIIENGTCKCPDAAIGFTEVINGVTYTAVDDKTIRTEITNGNVNLCTIFVTDMSELFRDNTSFNSDISFWDTSSVTNMSNMFREATAFNQDIGSWNTSSVTDMRSMFDGATAFNQDLTGWCVTNITSEPSRFATLSSLANANKPVWGTCD